MEGNWLHGDCEKGEMQTPAQLYRTNGLCIMQHQTIWIQMVSPRPVFSLGGAGCSANAVNVNVKF